MKKKNYRNELKNSYANLLTSSLSLFDIEAQNRYIGGIAFHFLRRKNFCSRLAIFLQVDFALCMQRKLKILMWTKHSVNQYTALIAILCGVASATAAR